MIDMFLKVDGVTGESMDINHTGWTHITNFQWGAEQPGSMNAAGGGGAGKVSVDDLKVYAPIDKIAPVLLQNCASGKHIKHIVVAVCKAGGEQLEYLRIEMSDVILTTVEFHGKDDEETMLVEYTFQGSTYKCTYAPQSEQGTKQASVAVGGNLKKNLHQPQ